MTTIQKLKSRLSATIGFALILGVVALGLGVKAFSSEQPPKIVNEAGGVVNFNEAPLPPPIFESQVIPKSQEDNLGASNNGIIVNNQLCINDDCTYHLVGSFVSGSTTIVSIANPFLAATTTKGDIIIANADGTATTSQVIARGFTGTTSTVELIRLKATTAATSTYGIACASSPYIGSTTTASIAMIDTVAVTSTYTIDSDVVGDLAQTAFYKSASTTRLGKIVLTPTQPYLVCKVGGAPANDSFIGNPTFVGRYAVRISGTH